MPRLGLKQLRHFGKSALAHHAPAIDDPAVFLRRAEYRQRRGGDIVDTAFGGPPADQCVAAEIPLLAEFRVQLLKHTITLGMAFE